MARVTLIFEDVVGGPTDGAVDFKWETKPTLALDETGMLDMENFTLAQRQALSAVGYIQMAYETVQPMTPTTRDED